MFSNQQEQIQNSNSCPNPQPGPSPSRLNPLPFNTKKSLSTATVGKLRPSAATTIPAQSGIVVGSGNYIVNVGLRSPKKQLSLIFDPATSASYINVSCNSVICSQLRSATGYTPRCSITSTCIYTIQYGDRSYSVGYFWIERLSLPSTDVFNGFLFGCGQRNKGHFGETVGLLGLGRNKISFVEQSALKYKRFFSYCLPSTSSGTGYLSFY